MASLRSCIFFTALLLSAAVPPWECSEEVALLQNQKLQVARAAREKDEAARAAGEKDENIPDLKLLEDFFAAAGLEGESARKIIDITGARKVKDLALLDISDQEEVIKVSGLKLIEGRKFRSAISEARNTSSAMSYEWVVPLLLGGEALLALLTYVLVRLSCKVLILIKYIHYAQCLRIAAVGFAFAAATSAGYYGLQWYQDNGWLADDIEFESLSFAARAVMVFSIAYLVSKAYDIVDHWIKEFLHSELSGDVDNEKGDGFKLLEIWGLHEARQKTEDFSNYLRSHSSSAHFFHEHVWAPFIFISKVILVLLCVLHLMEANLAAASLGILYVGAMTVGSILGGKNLAGSIWGCWVMVLHDLNGDVNVGDLVTINAVPGILERVTLLHTCIRRFDMKEELIPNANIATFSITNWSRRVYRIDSFKLYFSQRTCHTKLKAFQDTLKMILTTHPDVDQSKYMKANLTGFKSGSIDGEAGAEFSVVYGLKVGVSHKNAKSDILLRIHQAAENLQIALFDTVVLQPFDASKFYEDSGLALPSAQEATPSPQEQCSSRAQPVIEMFGFKGGPRKIQAAASSLHPEDENTAPGLFMDFRSPIVKEDAGGKRIRLSVLLCSVVGLPTSVDDTPDLTYVEIKILDTRNGDNVEIFETQSCVKPTFSGSAMYQEVASLGEIDVIDGYVLQFTIFLSTGDNLLTSGFRSVMKANLSIPCLLESPDTVEETTHRMLKSQKSKNFASATLEDDLDKLDDDE